MTREAETGPMGPRAKDASDPQKPEEAKRKPTLRAYRGRELGLPNARLQPRNTDFRLLSSELGKKPFICL